MFEREDAVVEVWSVAIVTILTRRRGGRRAVMVMRCDEHEVVLRIGRC